MKRILFVAALWFAAFPAYAQFSPMVQGPASGGAITLTNLGTTNPCGSATPNINPAVSVAAGSFIVVVLYDPENGGSGLVGTVADTKSNTYHLAGVTYQSGATGANYSIFYVFNAIALTTSDTITYTSPNSSCSIAMSVAYAATGVLATGDPLDQFGGNVGSCAGGPSVTLTPTVSGELFVGFVSSSSGSGVGANPSGFSIPPNTTFSGGNIGGNLTNPGTSAETYNPSVGCSAYGAVMASFKHS